LNVVLDARQDIGERAHVGWFFLHPDNFTRIRMARNFRAQLVLWKRIELIEKQDRRLVVATLFAFVAQLVTDFSCADQNALGGSDFAVGNNPLEPRPGKILDRRGSIGGGWLSSLLIRKGWSVKKLHKLILMSQAYQQSSQFDARAAEKDAENRLLWRYSPRRLEGEAIRDAMLAASGKLNPKMYGPSFRPFQVVKNSGSYHSYQPVDSDDPELQRRTVYRMNVNSGGNPMLEALDCPLPSVKTPKRTATTTALQALSLMNNAFVQRQSKAFSERLTKEAADTSSRVQRAFLLALGRRAGPDELAQSVSLVEQHGLETFCWGLFNASEFLYVH